MRHGMSAGCWRTVSAAVYDQVGGRLQLGLPAARLGQLELQLLVLGAVALRPCQLLLGTLALLPLVRQLLAGCSICSTVMDFDAMKL